MKHLPCHSHATQMVQPQSPALAVTLLASIAIPPDDRHRLHSHAKAVESETDDEGDTKWYR